MKDLVEVNYHKPSQWKVGDRVKLEAHICFDNKVHLGTIQLFSLGCASVHLDKPMQQNNYYYVLKRDLKKIIVSEEQPTM